MNVTFKNIDDLCGTCVTQDTCEVYEKYHKEYEVEACSDYKNREEKNNETDLY